MASPINTGGFAVNVMPGINYPDPRLLTPAYGSLIPAARQGLGAVGDFAQIRENARMAPVRQELAQIQLQQAQADAARAPIKAEMDRLQLAQLRQPIRTRLGSEIVRTPVTIGEDVEIPAGTEIPTGFDVQTQDIIQVYDPVTGGFKTERVMQKPILTSEQIAKNEAYVNSQNALANLRATGGAQSTALQRNIAAWEEAKAAGDVEKAALILQSIQKTQKPSKAEEIAQTWATVANLEASDNPSDIQLADVLRNKLLSATPSAYTNVAARAGFSPAETRRLMNTAGGTSAMAKINSNLANGLKEDYGLTEIELAAVDAARAGRDVAEAIVDDADADALIDAAAGAPSYTAANPARPTNKAEYDALPSGSFYIAQDGVTLKQKK